jgi:uncharacterized protein YacL
VHSPSRSFSLPLAVILGIALCADVAGRTLLVRLGVRYQPPVWVILVGAAITAVAYLALLFWSTTRTANFVRRARHRVRATILTAGVGGLLGGVGTLLVGTYDPSRTAPPLFPVARFVMTVVFAVVLVWLMARTFDRLDTVA